MQIRNILLTIPFLFTSFLLKAQPEIEVQESSADFNGDSRNALSVMVYGEVHDEVENKARKTFRGWGNVKNREAPLFIKEAENDDISDMPFNFYLKVEEQDDSTQKVFAAVNLGGAWLNSSDHSDGYDALSARLREFAVRVTKEAMEGVVEKEQKKLEELQNKLEDISDEKADEQGNIEDKKETIEKAKKTIEEAKSAIEDAEKRIEELDKKIKEQEEKIKAQEKRVKKVEKRKDAVN